MSSKEITVIINGEEYARKSDYVPNPFRVGDRVVVLDTLPDYDAWSVRPGAVGVVLTVRGSAVDVKFPTTEWWFNDKSERDDYLLPRLRHLAVLK
jgi:hypothetical protein